jgi:hypothetical protein
MGSIARILARPPDIVRRAAAPGGRPTGSAWRPRRPSPLMALLTACPRPGPVEMLCVRAHGSPLGGMVPMYLLMSAFHAAPWLRLLGGRGRLTRAA